MRGIGRSDVELLLVATLWAFNITVVKVVYRDMEPLAFNIVRFLGAAAVLLVLVYRREGSIGAERGDIGRLVLLGVVGHALYQTFFILGLSRTTASGVYLIVSRKGMGDGTVTGDLLILAAAVCCRSTRSWQSRFWPACRPCGSRPSLSRWALCSWDPPRCRRCFVKTGARSLLEPGPGARDRLRSLASGR